MHSVPPSLVFRFAKTMPENPHEYAVRSADNEAAYVELFHAIHRDGEKRKWNGRWYKYLRIGEFDYWAMTTFLPASRIINRARVVDAP
jgi:hypothetical protein